jgi:hypothetical protein
VRARLAWAGTLTVGVLVVGMVYAFASQGVNAIAVFREALVQGDPDVVSRGLLRTAFRSEDLAEVGANLRHKVFLAVLVGVFLGLACLGAVARRRRAARAVILASSAFGFVVVLLSLSRSAIVCLAIPLLLVALRLLVQRRARVGHLLIVGAAAVVVAILAVSPVADLLISRFSSTNSYDARIQGTIGDEFLAEFRDAALIGIDAPLAPLGTHNLVLDAWLAGGAIAGACALVMCISLGLAWGRCLRSYLTGGRGWQLPVNQLWMLGIGAIPLVRAVTAANQFHLVEWTAVGVFLAVLTANEREARPS